MPEIRVDFLAGSGFSSRLIEWFGLGHGGYSHVASVLQDGRYLDARSDRLQGVPPGVHIRAPESEAWVRKRRVSLPVTEEEYASWEANLRAKIGDGYGVIDIIHFIDGDGGHQSAHYICSALAINAIQHVSRCYWQPDHAGYVPFPLYVPAHQVTPDTCLLILQTAGFAISEEIFA